MVDRRTWHLAKTVLGLSDHQKKHPTCVGYLKNLHKALGQEIERLTNGEKKEAAEKEKEGNAQAA
jgi:hypothetical protein